MKIIVLCFKFRKLFFPNVQMSHDNNISQHGFMLGTEKMPMLYLNQWQQGSITWYDFTTQRIDGHFANDIFKCISLKNKLCP